MMIEKKEDSLIADRIVELMKTHFRLKCDFSQNMFNMPLTGRPYELSGTELYQLLMLIEKEYGIYIRPDDIRQYGFSTINNAVNMVLMYT